MRKYLNNNKNIIFLLCLFIIIQPFIDMKVLFENDNLAIFGITIPTIIRTFFIGFIGLFMFLKSDDKKEKKWILFYFIIICIYSLIHHLIVKEPMDVPDHFSYSVMTEAFYVIRMILPLIVIYITKNAKVTYDKYINVILYSAITIGLVIVISNTFLISYTSYPSSDIYTKASWISWIFGDISKYEFEELTSKGWFYMGNQVAGLTLLLLPLCINDMLKKMNLKNFLATTSLTLAMIILGTRTSAYGWVIVYVTMIILSIFLYLFKLYKDINYKSLNILVLLLVIFLSVLLVSPIRTREYTKDLKPILPSSDLPIDGDIYKYIKENYEGFGIHKKNIEDLYSYKYDYVFWLDVFDKSRERILDNREIELLIADRIISRNRDDKYSLFGYSFSRLRNAPMSIEHDFLAQQFAVGYIGILTFIAPYFLAIISISLKALKKKKICLTNVTFLIAMIAIFGSSIFTGHILDELFVMIYVGFIIGYFASLGGQNEEDMC